MSFITDSNATDSADNTLTVITDGETTSGVKAGVTAANRLKVDAIVNASTQPVSWSSKLRYVDMNVASNGVARGTSITNAAWTTIFSYSGSGLVAGFVVNIETATDWLIRFVVDGEEIFPSAGIVSDDLGGDAIWDLDTADTFNFHLNLGDHDKYVWVGPLNIPIRYSTSVVIYLRRVTGAAAKKFQAGIINLTKET